MLTTRAQVRFNQPSLRLFGFLDAHGEFPDGQVRRLCPVFLANALWVYLALVGNLLADFVEPFPLLHLLRESDLLFRCEQLRASALEHPEFDFDAVVLVRGLLADSAPEVHFLFAAQLVAQFQTADAQRREVVVQHIEVVQFGRLHLQSERVVIQRVPPRLAQTSRCLRIHQNFHLLIQYGHFDNTSYGRARL
jgi:hypothetical protein